MEPNNKKYVIEVEPALEAKDGRPSMGPVYRSIFAKDGFPPPIDGLDSCWDIFRYSLDRFACFFIFNICICMYLLKLLFILMDQCYGAFSYIMVLFLYLN